MSAVYTLQEWLNLEDQKVVEIVAPRISTVAIYLNGTRRWFLSRHKNWTNYTKITSKAQRELSQLCYDHGIQTLIQPLLGYDLLQRGSDYLKLAVEQGLVELASKEHRNWYRQANIRVTFYGNWVTTLAEMGFTRVVTLLNELMAETRPYTKHRLLLGIFADEGLDYVVALAKTVRHGEELLAEYYGQPIDPINLIIGSGQPAIWDLPLLDINKASLYFLQAPTFYLDKEKLRRILYDHLYQRINDDELYKNLSARDWQRVKVLGVGRRTHKGWIAG